MAYNILIAEYKDIYKDSDRVDAITLRDSPAARRLKDELKVEPFHVLVEL